MWVETILSREDLAQLLGELLPAKIRLGTVEEDNWLALYELGDVLLVPETGLRVTCKAKLRWDIVGISVPITLHSLTVLLRPTILKRETGDVLSFGLFIEHADLANVPDFIDGKITDRVNKALAAREDFSWDFSTALSRVVTLPAMIEPVDAIDLRVAWGKLRIDENALVIVVSFHAHMLRDGIRPVAPLVVPAPPTLAASRKNSNPNAILIATGVAFVFGTFVASLWTRRY